jgi:Alpha amylase, catalytic domain
VPPATCKSQLAPPAAWGAHQLPAHFGTPAQVSGRPRRRRLRRAHALLAAHLAHGTAQASKTRSAQHAAVVKEHSDVAVGAHVLPLYPASRTCSATRLASARTMQAFVEELGDIVGGVHVLPFYPSSADRGFAPLTYKQVDERFGDWSSIEAIAEDHDVCVDFMVNHTSAQSAEFQDFLAKGDEVRLSAALSPLLLTRTHLGASARRDALHGTPA